MKTFLCIVAGIFVIFFLVKKIFSLAKFLEEGDKVAKKELSGG